MKPSARDEQGRPIKVSLVRVRKGGDQRTRARVTMTPRPPEPAERIRARKIGALLRRVTRSRDPLATLTGGMAGMLVSAILEKLRR